MVSACAGCPGDAQTALRDTWQMTARQPDSISDEETVVLWRPTGPKEIELVRATGSTRWPPRLPDQPIFYPVLNEDYATRIARDWNVKASGVGYVTRFSVRKSFLDRYEVRQEVARFDSATGQGTGERG